MRKILGGCPSNNSDCDGMDLGGNQEAALQRPGERLAARSVCQLAHFYSSWDRGYGVGYATATSIRGPWKKYAHKPIDGAQGRGWCHTYKHRYTQKKGDPYCQVGGNSLFVGPDGKIWICAHAYRTGVDNVLHPHMVIDPLWYRMGWIDRSGGHGRVRGMIFGRTPVSFTPQRVPIKHDYFPPRGKQRLLMK